MLICFLGSGLLNQPHLPFVGGQEDSTSTEWGWGHTLPKNEIEFLAQKDCFPEGSYISALRKGVFRGRWIEAVGAAPDANFDGRAGDQDVIGVRPTGLEHP